MAKIIQVDGLDDEIIKILNREAQKNSLSRNALLVLVIETFAQNVEMVESAENLALPLQDVTQQLNQLTHAISNSNYNISHDFNALRDATQKNNLLITELVQSVNTLVKKLTR
ncbi:hypothetical protein ACHWP0_07655 [Weissella cibaria]|uniref:hypothetical protein n=1 Tax=Weissella cibaria TaxID=137591 RepID=UPI00376F446D